MLIEIDTSICPNFTADFLRMLVKSEYTVTVLTSDGAKVEGVISVFQPGPDDAIEGGRIIVDVPGNSPYAIPTDVIEKIEI